MVHTMMGSKTDREIMEEIGRRLRAYRLQRNLGVREVAARAGLNRNTVLKAEAGANPTLQTVVKILRVLERLDGLDAFLPAPGLSPLQLMKLGAKPRQRARKPRHG